ncbi:hypothetical protein DXG01_007153 [Tephrocybe rancida]|nr:hypothetical protein DXG01_007153 [Tephrocybe rancida]
MAYRSQDASPSGSQSPSVTSSNNSPAPHNSPMVPVPDDNDHGVRASPHRHPIDLPRIPSASKGGCWSVLASTSLHKCDEQREGDSCKTCLRLTIKCLGWGPRRPEWMRDKQEVERYKADIKAQLTRAGLIRGQPRTSQVYQNSSSMVPSQIRPHPYHRSSAPEISTSSSVHFDHPDYGYRYVNTPREQHSHPRPEHNHVPGMPGASNSAFQQIPDPLYTDTPINALDLHSPFYYPQSVTPISSSSSTIGTDIPIDFSHLGSSQEPAGFEFDLRPPSPLPPAPLPLSAGENYTQDHVIYYFEHVRKIQFIFAGNSLTNATHSIIMQEPRGAVTNAVCALASLHYTRMRVAQGLEAPDPNPENFAAYFHREACLQLETAKQARNPYTDSEAMAAVHLVCYSQLSGGTADWQPAFGVLCDWLTQTGLLSDENPAITLHAMSATAQILVKATLWFDTFSSLSLVRAPKYLRLFKRLLGERGGYWPAVGDSDGLHSLRMDLLTGCPDEAMLALAEVTNLAYWKASEQHKGTLSFRELVRRGDDIEQRLRRHRSTTGRPGDLDPAPLHSHLQTPAMEPRVAPFPTEEARRTTAKLFCEAAVLSLHTVLSNANPGVSEIGESVETIVGHLNQLTPSEVDRALVFPICLAGSLTDNSSRREFCKARLQRLDDSIGNLMQTRLVMEAVWQKRDVSSVAVSVGIRETIQERGMNLLFL